MSRASLAFLVGAFLVKRARLLQWLVFFRQTIHSSRMYHFLWIIHFYQKYSVFNFERIQRPLPWNAKPRRVPLPIFRRYETFPAPFFGFVRLFSKIFFKGTSPLLFFFGVLQLNGCWKKPKGPPFTFFGSMRLLKILIFRFFLENFKRIFEIFQCLRRVAPQFFWYFATNWIFKKPKESSLLQFYKLCTFWALDMAPTLDVPVLL